MNAALGVRFLAGAFFAAAFLAGAFLATTFLAGAAFLAAGFLAATFLAGAFLAATFLAGAFFAAAFLAGAFFAGAFFAVAMVDFLLEVFVFALEKRTLSSNTDANREKTAFQVKNDFFHARLLFLWRCSITW
jgi:uncharacterized membrane protein